MPHSEDRLHWEGEIPPLPAIYERGGVPGKEYAYVTFDRASEAQAAGYRQTAPVFFTLSGPGGSKQFVVMERGEGITGLPPESARPPLLVDEALRAVLTARSEGAEAEPSVEPEAGPAPSSEAAPAPSSSGWRMPCGSEKTDKRAASGHLRWCKRPECADARASGITKADQLEV